jgi:chromosome segregation ATPase
MKDTREVLQGIKLAVLIQQVAKLTHDRNNFLCDLEEASKRIAELDIEGARLDRESQELSDQLGACDRGRRAALIEVDQLRSELAALREQPRAKAAC